ncbi:C-signal-like [Trichechus inunguis]
MSQNTPSSVLVTGANRGLGLELVRQLLALPQPPKPVFATCRNPSGPQAQSLRDLAEQEPNLRILRLDVTDSASIQLAECQVRHYLSGEGLALLVNNAGVMNRSSLDTVTASDMQLLYQTSVVGPLLLGQTFGSLLRRAARTHPQKELSWARAAIINISSASGSITHLRWWELSQIVSYRCSKAALNMLTRCQATAYAEEGILCAGISPGWVDTDMGSSFLHTLQLTVTESIQGVLKVMSQLTEKEAGAHLDWEGHIIPWPE